MDVPFGMPRVLVGSSNLADLQLTSLPTKDIDAVESKKAVVLLGFVRLVQPGSMQCGLLL